MKCPYTVDVEEVTQDAWEYDEAGQTIFHETKRVVHRVYVDCLKEECGAWHDGRCTYKED